MRQVLQWLDTGKVELREIPVPEIGPRQLLVESRASLVSAGTERMLVEFGRAGLWGKVKSQPERVRQVVDKIRTDGLGPTLDAVRSKLGEPIPLGYCNAGVVRRVGAEVPGFRVGDRVATNGAHAEWVRVPHTLAAKIPDGVSDEAACFAPLAAVALQGIRLAAPALGETVVVVGLGLVGLLTVQLLRANGCRVLGIDLDPDRRELARGFGAKVVSGDGAAQVAAVLEATDGFGADAVLLTLSSQATEPVNLAAAMARPRGRVVLVGVTGLELDREPFFRKELSFAVSCSYGPGRYEAAYEAGHDIPPAHVRWTAQRNFAAVLDQMAAGGADPTRLISHRIPFAEAGRAYDVITGDAKSLGVVLEYPADAPAANRVERVRRAGATPGSLVAGVIGAGNYAR
ncbi:MAG: zinc-binding alcohol dehydrogenase, partial [Gemmatimonadales bacterium]